ncbi:class I SAM-dependent methyltransferase [Gramella sp. GC03-9]|uniref:Class I SAM-dependent methyltransferase n=1 Tax=Christiangramia oceanisediminis TaxID=2920386 RepID=A0A9X2KWC4_9FLAO|nr:class I SAM-dependent methyltransferase [Gramella oceanisediminis]MCP9199303.1 class I SAM-dependent methyltransferase [Gramella oceanisediminis]
MRKAPQQERTKATSGINLVCQDHLVSGKKFTISEYEPGILKTEPVPENLSHYYESDEYISHSDSSNNIQDKIYQVVKSYMLDQKAKWIIKEKGSGRILDFGAGTGDFLKKMKSVGWEIEGVEPSSTARNLADKKELNLKSDLASISKTKFDVISLWHVLEHIPDFENQIKNFSELLDENGILVIAVPNYNSHDCNYYKEFWAAWDVPRHLWHFSRTGLQSKLSELGFSLLKEQPLLFDSFYVSLLSEKHKAGKANYMNALYQGSKSNTKAKSSGEYSSIAYFFQKSTKTSI